MYVWMDGWMDGRMNGWMDGQMDGRVGEKTYVIHKSKYEKYINVNK